MNLPRHFSITITGDTDTFLQRSGVGGLQYLLDRLFSGEAVAEDEFGKWGLRVTQAVDTAALRGVTEDDVEQALGEGCFVELPLRTPAEVLEAWNCLLDAKLGRDE